MLTLGDVSDECAQALLDSDPSKDILLSNDLKKDAKVQLSSFIYRGG